MPECTTHTYIRKLRLIESLDKIQGLNCDFCKKVHRSKGNRVMLLGCGAPLRPYGVIIHRMKRIGLLLIFLGALLSVFQPARAQTDEPLAIVMTADGPIVPPMLEYFKRGIQTAERENAEVLIIQLNTPGGSISTMFEIVEAIGKSTVPVVIYVSPKDAQAASAGALITMAGHVSAVSPRTVIGAASPFALTNSR